MEATTVKADTVHVLFVDDDTDFTQSLSPVLERREFTVTALESETQALDYLDHVVPDVILLDLKLNGGSGTDLLQKIREKDNQTPVIILTGHGSMDSVVSSIRFGVSDYLQKPVDIDLLVEHLLDCTSNVARQPMRERSLVELMRPVSLYPKLLCNQPIEDALYVVRKWCFPDENDPDHVRSALVYEPNGDFIGMLRFHDLLSLVLPEYLRESSHPNFFPGMVLAQCKLIDHMRVLALMSKQVYIRQNAPLMEAVQLMVKHHVVNLPVMDGKRLAGVLRERDVVRMLLDCMYTK